MHSASDHDDQADADGVFEVASGQLVGVSRRFPLPSHLRDEAESVALLGLDAAIRSRHGRRTVSFVSWVSICVERRLLDMVKAEARHAGRLMRLASSLAAPDESPPAADAADADDSFERLISPLPPLARRMYRIVFVDGFTHSEAGRMLGIPKTTALELYHRSAAALRAASSVPA